MNNTRIEIYNVEGKVKVSASWQGGSELDARN